MGTQKFIISFSLVCTHLTIPIIKSLRVNSNHNNKKLMKNYLRIVGERSSIIYRYIYTHIIEY